MKKIYLLSFIFISSICATIASDGFHYVVEEDGTVRPTGRKGPGCVLGDTKVYLENGTKTEIYKIKSNHVLQKINEHDAVVIGLVKGPEKAKVIRISTESGKSITATQNHPFFKNNLLYKTSEFKEGDFIDTIDGQEMIINIEAFKTKQEVYNVILANSNVIYQTLGQKEYLRKYPFQQLPAQGHRLVLNGFISGDLIIQKVQP